MSWKQTVQYSFADALLVEHKSLSKLDDVHEIIDSKLHRNQVQPSLCQQTLKGLPVARWHASYDVQAGHVCRRKLASPARV